MLRYFGTRTSRVCTVISEQASGGIQTLMSDPLRYRSSAPPVCLAAPLRPQVGAPAFSSYTARTRRIRAPVLDRPMRTLMENLFPQGFPLAGRATSPSTSMTHGHRRRLPWDAESRDLDS